MIDIPTKEIKAANNAAVKDETPAQEKVGSNRDRKVDELGRSYGTGRRKNSSARVWIKPGKGAFVVNGQTIDKYFPRKVLQMIINQPFQVTGNTGSFDVYCTVSGGGLSGQAGAVKHGISRALLNYNPLTNHGPLKQAGFLTRDPRVVERKKYGKKKARKSFQFSKR